MGVKAGGWQADEVAGMSCLCEGTLSVGTAVVGVAATGYPCVVGDAWTMYQGVEGMARCGGTEGMEVGRGRGTKDGEGMTARLWPRFGCEGREVPLAAAASCACASVF